MHLGPHYVRTYLKSNVRILVHSKDLWLITEWKTLNVVFKALDSVGLGGIVQPWRRRRTRKRGKREREDEEEEEEEEEEKEARIGGGGGGEDKEEK